tara:strand:- start:97 stop:321 length:225 start_codon:yes stop_codon:yes gene_type:complete
MKVGDLVERSDYSLTGNYLPNHFTNSVGVIIDILEISDEGKTWIEVSFTGEEPGWYAPHELKTIGGSANDGATK